MKSHHPVFWLLPPSLQNDPGIHVRVLLLILLVVAVTTAAINLGGCGKASVPTEVDQERYSVVAIQQLPGKINCMLIEDRRYTSRSYIILQDANGGLAITGR